MLEASFFHSTPEKSAVPQGMSTSAVYSGATVKASAALVGTGVNPMSGPRPFGRLGAARAVSAPARS